MSLGCVANPSCDLGFLLSQMGRDRLCLCAGLPSGGELCNLLQPLTPTGFPDGTVALQILSACEKGQGKLHSQAECIVPNACVVRFPHRLPPQGILLCESAQGRPWNVE